MIVAKIQVNDAIANTVYRKVIPAGIISAQVQFDYAADLWAGLHKTVVFRGAVTKDVITNADVVTIPAEVVAKYGVALRVGIYGVDADGNLAIPTIWADLGIVRDAADPSGDTTTDPSLPIWAQIQAMIGNLEDLDTTAKNNLVAAVNEAMTKGGGTVDAAEIKRIVDDYLAANPPTVTESDPTVPAWAKQPKKPTYTAAEVGALPDTYTPPNQTAQQVGADPAGTAASAVSQHNVDAAAHNDLRLTLQELANRINAALDSDDTTMDQMSEVVAYIKSNKSLIDAITTSKVSVADIVNDLATNATGKPLSAAQGVVLKQLIDDLQAMIPEGGSGIAVSGATVGQTVKISAVDENGKPTAWEPVDLPSGGGGDLQWYKVAETETTEEITEYVVSQDFDGNPIKSYNPVAIALYFATPADSTQASTNGVPWMYPSASSTATDIRAIGSIPGWKTHSRVSMGVFFGSEHGIIGLGTANSVSLNPVGLESAIMDGVRIRLNASGDHFPVGTHFIVSVFGVRV